MRAPAESLSELADKLVNSRQRVGSEIRAQRQRVSVLKDKLRKLRDDDGDEMEFFVAPAENKGGGMLLASPDSPLGAALMGATEGDTVTYEAPGGTFSYVVAGVGVPQLTAIMDVVGAIGGRDLPVIADGGEVIIYAPHIDEISYTHGQIIDKVGYHVRDYFVNQWDRFKDYPWGVLAHSTHLRGVGTYENGVEEPRIRVTLATGIPRERCDQVNLGYLDPDAINPDEWRGREAEGILLVPKAGEMLYRVK